MADYRSKYISALRWDIKTDDRPGSGTDARVTVTVLRDDKSILGLAKLRFHPDLGGGPELDGGWSLHTGHYPQHG